ncbi:uncharacterized protein BKCO1_1000651 [Diplodia corticola]|uniref:Cytochrome oxidase c assembly domain-containing protein n=1 Tax=Diplodia corticola TaxID=236234 RepID=A0A1J9SKV9_9PEZI|nr:uncharacterized protein BKCO1_1000651 [Diplodia corticola]OJD40245.1 hypothetical protein BKCO1_1000651 [Diplodia corticola]
MSPRSAMDATRFTATGPYAHSKSTKVPLNSSSAPKNETPQQKIARLRAAAQKAKGSQVSTFDKIVAGGRVWADRAHRVTALSLIAITGIAGVVTVFALGDMIVYNRRKRREWFHEQNQKHAISMAEAKQAVAAGTATEDQILLLNNERNKEEHEKNKKGFFKRTKESIFGGFSKEEEQGGQLGAIAAEARDAFISDAQTTKDQGSGVLRAVEEKRREGEKAQAPSPGPLDRMAEDAAEAATQKSKSWTSWVTGR